MSTYNIEEKHITFIPVTAGWITVTYNTLRLLPAQENNVGCSHRNKQWKYYW